MRAVSSSVVRTAFMVAVGGAVAFASACGTEGDLAGGDGGDRRDGDDEGGAGGPDGGGNICDELTVGASRGIPNILIVLDRSRSMADGGRWTPARQAIKNVTANLDTGIAFGLMMYPSNNSCGTGGSDIAPATGTAGAIETVLDDANSNGMTPTADALDAAGDALAPLSGQSYVLLVTDGGPNCNGSLPRESCTCTIADGCAGWGGDADFCLDSDRSIERVAALATAGVSTYVIGFDTSEWTAVLDGMAAAGDTERTTYVPVSSGTELENTLAELAGNVVSCSFTLDSTPSDYRYVRVKLNGVDVPHVSQTDGNSGWDLDGSRIDLVGATCDALKDAEDPELNIKVECEAVIL